MIHSSSSVRVVVTLTLLMLSGTASALLPFERTGNLYVSMWSANEIAVFTPEGTPVERFSAGGLQGPRGIAFNPANGEIWIAGEFSNAIHIFDHQHQLLRTLEHEDFDEPVGVTFSGPGQTEQLVYISNSNGNEIMVFDSSGELQRRFTGPDLLDPNCSALWPDGSLLVANRLGGSNGAIGAVSRFDSADRFLNDFTTTGIASLMAVARDPKSTAMTEDDTLWVTSGAGDTGIYEFDLDGNVLNTLLPAAIGDGRNIVPQGIAFDGNGDFYVVSFLNEVLKFDANGEFLTRFSTGSGTSRSTAFQGCRADISERCVPLGVSATDVVDSGPVTPDPVVSDSGSGGGTLSALPLALIALFRRRTRS